MRKLFVPGLFVALAVLAIDRGVGALSSAVGHLGAKRDLIALYYVLQASIATAFAFAAVRRPAPKQRSRDPLAFVACVLAMALVLPVGGPTAGGATGLMIVGDAFTVAACIWLLVAVLTLGRCFGILPEARGLVTRGPYRLVRHPIYLGEIAAMCGLALASPSVVRLAACVLFVGAQAVRMRMEESALTAAFPEYGRYAAQTGQLWPRLKRGGVSQRAASRLGVERLVVSPSNSGECR
jgi:protein-S-isoprenylcysteine O-methyltransferase Ste14